MAMGMLLPVRSLLLISGMDPTQWRRPKAPNWGAQEAEHVGLRMRGFAPVFFSSVSWRHYCIILSWISLFQQFGNILALLGTL